VKRTKISTDSLEVALDQIVRSRASGVKASINTQFIASILKELIDYRNAEKGLRDEVEVLFYGKPDPEPLIMVEEVQTLSELGNTSWSSGSKDAPSPDSPEEEDQALNEESLLHRRKPRPILRSRRSLLVSSGMHQARWGDGSDSRRFIIIALLIVIAVTLATLFL